MILLNEAKFCPFTFYCYLHTLIPDFDDDDSDDESSEDKSEKESSNEEGNEEKEASESGKDESGSNTETGDDKSKQEVATRVKRETEVCFSKIEILIHFSICHYCQSCIFYQTIQRSLPFDRKRANVMITVFSEKMKERDQIERWICRG